VTKDFRVRLVSRELKDLKAPKGFRVPPVQPELRAHRGIKELRGDSVAQDSRTFMILTLLIVNRWMVILDSATPILSLPLIYTLTNKTDQHLVLTSLATYKL
jgi:hypothetical protein